MQYYNRQCNEVLIVLRVLSQAHELVERPNQSISDRQSARATTITACANPNMGRVSHNSECGFTFSLCVDMVRNAHVQILGMLLYSF